MNLGKKYKSYVEVELMTARPNPFPLRVDKTTLEKVKVIAQENGRSLNKEIEQLMKNLVKTYELENGVISVEIDSEE